MYTPIQHRPLLNNVDITNVFETMSPTTFAYSVYCLLLVGITLSAMIAATDSSRNLYKTLNHFLRAIWSIIETLIDQENYRPIIASAQIVWLFLNYFIVVIIFGHFLNLISVNQIASQPPILLEMISDFRKPEFQHVIPTMPKNFFYYEVLDRSEEGTDLRYAYDRMIRTGNCTGSNTFNYDVCNVLTVDMVETPKYMEQLMNRFDRSSAKLDFALLGSEIIGDQVVVLHCLIDSKTRKNFFKTPSFMSGYLTSIFSKQINDQVYKVYSFRLASFYLEFGLWFKIISHNVIDEFCDKFAQFSTDTKYFKCMENRPSHNEIGPIPASLIIYSNLIRYCTYAIAVSFFLLLSEFAIRLVLNRIASHRRKVQLVKLFMTNRISLSVTQHQP